MPRLKSIRFILILAFTLSLLMPIIAMMLYGHLFTSEALTNRALDREQSEVRLQAEHIALSLEHIREDVRYLATLETLNIGNFTVLENDFLAFAEAHPMYYRLNYLDKNGNTLSGVIRNPESVLAIPDAMRTGSADTSYFQQMIAMESNQSNIALVRVGGIPIMRYSLRLENGLIVADILATWVLRNMPVLEENRVWALLSYTGEHVLYPFNDSYTGAIAATDEALSPYMPNFNAETMGTFDVENNVFIFSRVSLGGDGQQYWILYQQLPRAELYQAVDDFYRSSFIMIGGAVLIAVGLAIVISGQIINPILTLRRKARDFAAGLPISDEENKGDLYEIGELSRTFHQMASQLDEERHKKAALIKKLIHAQEDERKRIAYDLHDGLIQQLVGAHLYLSMLRDGDTTGDNLAQSSTILGEAIGEGRRIIQGLHPTILDDLGLVDALAELTHQQGKLYGWQVNLQLQQLPFTPDKTISVTIFRIVQEALNNIGKHAEASTVRLTLSNGNAIHLTIADDGRGFDVANNGKEGFGIGTMRERAELLEGTCHIESTIGEGTQVIVTLPYGEQVKTINS